VDLGLGQALEFIWIPSLHIWVGRTEITNGQFKRFQRHHNSGRWKTFKLDHPDQPACRISWHDADAFCTWLNRNYSEYLPVDTAFRLPTSAEWEAFASCGDKTRRYPWGNEWPPPAGNFSDLSLQEHATDWRGITNYTDGCIVTCPVEESGKSKWDLYGIAGNVWEWCEDWFDTSKTVKIRRGGGWDFDAEPDLRLDAVGFDRPEARYPTIGFRVVIGKNSEVRSQRLEIGDQKS
jgi:formylglycine-generating enzyme required for sulfatase activity